MKHDLGPVPNRWIRLTLMLVAWGLVLSGGDPWPARLILMTGAVLLFGTWRQFRVGPKTLMHRWTVAFVALPHRSWKLRRFTRLEVTHENATTTMELLLFGLFGLIYGWFLNLFFPWVGGEYRIWLNDDHDTDRVLAWQGSSQQKYEQNLDRLRVASRLELFTR